MKEYSSLIGKRYGKLVVIQKNRIFSGRTAPMWECRCECGNITYKATDTLTNPDESMCQECHNRLALKRAREAAGFLQGTQLSKIRDMTPSAANTSGYRGIYYESKHDRYRAQIIFQRKRCYLGTNKNIEDAIKARKRAEQELYDAFLEK